MIPPAHPLMGFGLPLPGAPGGVWVELRAACLVYLRIPHPWPLASVPRSQLWVCPTCQRSAPTLYLLADGEGANCEYCHLFTPSNRRN